MDVLAYTTYTEGDAIGLTFGGAGAGVFSSFEVGDTTVYPGQNVTLTVYGGDVLQVFGTMSGVVDESGIPYPPDGSNSADLTTGIVSGAVQCPLCFAALASDGPILGDFFYINVDTPGASLSFASGHNYSSTATPEPASLVLLGTAMLGLVRLLNSRLVGRPATT
jgi:hypothetical protein